eukprot:6978874-Ditylum_brightwellii.AAC.1
MGMLQLLEGPLDTSFPRTDNMYEVLFWGIFFLIFHDYIIDFDKPIKILKAEQSIDLNSSVVTIGVSVAALSLAMYPAD